jgi:DNA polymerase III delta' subunit
MHLIHRNGWRNKMSLLKWEKCIGQERVKSVLGTAFENNTLGHAYLLCGDAGCGKFAAAFELAQALLCISSEEHKPCRKCSSCVKIGRYAHSDFHVIMPVSLDKEHKSTDGKLSEAGWQLLSQSVIERISNPYKIQTHASIPVIPLEWVKEVNHAIMRGPLESTQNVVIMDGIDLMAKEAANAMLKTLEEPPPGTTILLCTSRIHAVLPTIISRCQIIRFGWLPPDSIRDTLAHKFSLDPQDPKLNSCIHTGSLGLAEQLFDNPIGSVGEDALEFWNACVGQNWQVVTSLIDKFINLDDYGNYEKVFTQIMLSIRYSFFRIFNSSENYIMGDRSLEIPIPGIRTPDQAAELVDFCEKGISYLRARANIALVFADFAISVMEKFNGKKC